MVIIWRLYSRKTSSLLNEVCVFRTIQKRTGEYAYVQNRNKVILGYQSLLELPFLQYPRVKQSLLHVLFLNVCSHTCSFFAVSFLQCCSLYFQPFSSEKMKSLTFINYGFRNHL